jgi:hypothetical protein
MAAGALPLFLLFACGQSVAPAAPVTGSSKTVTVRGEYAPVALDRVTGLALENGRLVIRGPSTNVTVDPPASADPAKPVRGWALVTESTSGDTRSLTFTHETTLDDFTIDLPASDAELHYGVLAGRTGGEVMVFAWGEESRSYWGHVTIARK